MGQVWKNHPVSLLALEDYIPLASLFTGRKGLQVVKLGGLGKELVTTL